MDTETLIGYLINPIAGAIGWLFGRRQRRNTAIQSLQETIKLLSSTIQDDNQKMVSFMNEMQELRRENAELKAGQNEVRRENAELKAGQEKLMAQIEALKTENRELNELVKAAGLARQKKASAQKKPQTPAN